MNKSAASRKNVLKRVWVVIITPYYVTYVGSWMRVCKLIYHTKPHQMANTLKKKEEPSTPQSRYILNIAIILGLIEGVLLYTLLFRPLLQK